MHRSDMSATHVWKCGVQAAANSLSRSFLHRHSNVTSNLFGLRVGLVTSLPPSPVHCRDLCSTQVSALQQGTTALVMQVGSASFHSHLGLQHRQPWLGQQHRTQHATAQAATGNGSSSLSPVAAQPPAALRIIDEELHVEAERSYLAVSFHSVVASNTLELRLSDS